MGLASAHQIVVKRSFEHNILKSLMTAALCNRNLSLFLFDLSFCVRDKDLTTAFRGNKCFSEHVYDGKEQSCWLNVTMLSALKYLGPLHIKAFRHFREKKVMQLQGSAGWRIGHDCVPSIFLWCKPQECFQLESSSNFSMLDWRSWPVCSQQLF